MKDCGLSKIHDEQLICSLISKVFMLVHNKVDKAINSNYQLIHKFMAVFAQILCLMSVQCHSLLYNELMSSI